MQHKKKSRGGVIAAAIGLGLLLVGGSALAAEDDAPKVPEKPWLPGPGGKGKVFGGKGKGKGELPADLPSDFDYGGNGIYVDPECQYVIEGNLFWQGYSGSLQLEAETLEAVLALDPQNSVLGFVDYLIDTLGYRQPEQVAWKILEEASPMCAAVDPGQWGLGLQSWYNDLLDRVVLYMDEATKLMRDDFDPYEEEEFDDGPHLDVWEDDEFMEDEG